MPVTQQGDAGVVVKLECSGYAAVILVVAQTGHHGGLEASEGGCHILLEEGLYVPVDDVAADENEVGVLGIHQVYPAVELIDLVRIAQMQVRNHHHGHVFGQSLGGLHLDGLAHFVHVVQVAVGEDSGKHQQHGERALPAVDDEGVGHKVQGTAQVEQKVEQHGIDQDHDARGADVVAGSGQRQGPAVEAKEPEVGEEQQHAQEHHRQDGGLTDIGQRQDMPRAPEHIGDARQGQGRENENP